MRVSLLFVITVALFALAMPTETWPQQRGKQHRVGYLTPFPLSFDAKLIELFEQTLSERGYTNGRNISIIYKSAEDHAEMLPKLAADLLRLEVDVFVTHGTPATRAAQQITSTIPIVMLTVLDPVHAGFVATLSHPGGNITGSSELSEELIPKRLELVKEMLPAASIVAVLWDPAHPTNGLDLKRTEAAAQTLGLRIKSIPAHDAQGYEKAFVEMRRWHPDALIVLTSPAATGRLKEIGQLALKNRIPTMYGSRIATDLGVLVSYGPDFTDQYRHAAVFVDKILKGAKPSDLPVEQPTRFELAINLKTARMLGVTIPEPIQERADVLIK